MQKKRYVQLLLVAIIATLLLSLSGCLTAEQRAELTEFGTSATTYYKDKYGEDPHVESCGYYVDGSGLFPRRTKHMFARCDNGEFIFYNADKDQMVDNHQSAKISDAIADELAKQMEEVEAIAPGSEIIIRDYCSSAYAGSYKGNFYHNYYDGDITAFLEVEDVQLTANMYLLCDETAPWEEAQKKCEDIIRKNFRTDEDVTLTILSRSCYEEKQGEYGVYAGLDDLGCYAKYHMTGTTTDSYIQNYIKIADGLYVTCSEKNFIFEDGDVVATEAISEADLNAVIFGRYDKLPAVAEENADGSYRVHDKTKETYSVATAVTPVYQLAFSERVKAAFPDGEINAYMMLVPDETGASDSDQLLRYTNKENSYWCSAIVAANDGDAGWVSISENDYYFVGSCIQKGPAEKEN